MIFYMNSEMFVRLVGDTCAFRYLELTERLNLPRKGKPLYMILHSRTRVRFLQDFAAQLVQVQALQSKAQEGFASLVSFFGENPNSITADSSFWQPISNFAQTFSSAQQIVLNQQQVLFLILFLNS